MPDEDDRFCFVISPIGEPGTATRRQADGVLEEIIEPALQDDFARIERADRPPAPGIVTTQIIQDLIEADLVVADLTGPNPNVMYELAIRHANGGPFVHMAEQGQELPFDIQGVHNVYYSPELKGRGATEEELRSTARAAIEQEQIDNPVASAVNFLELGQTGEPGDKAIADAVQDIRSQMSALRQDVSRMRHQVPESLVESAPTMSVGQQASGPDYEITTIYGSSSSRHTCQLCGDELQDSGFKALVGLDQSGKPQLTVYLCQECASEVADEPSLAHALLREEEDVLSG